MAGEEDRHSSYLVFYAVQPLGTSDLRHQSIDKRASNSVDGNFNEVTKAVIQLYMPNMNENIAHNYETDDGGGIISDFLTNYKTSSQAGESFVSSIGAGLGSTLDRMSVAGETLRQDYNTKATGKLLGSREAHMYRSSAPRQQTFNFQLRPRNVKELKHVGNILRTFMVYSAASKTEREVLIDNVSQSYSALEMPHLWFVEERFNQTANRAVNRFTPKFAMGPAAITNIRMNKTPDQLYETFDQTAGDPIAIDLEITLTELRPIFREYYEKLTKGLGEPEFVGSGGNAFFSSFK
jgi:hypothetical protein